VTCNAALRVRPIPKTAIPARRFRRLGQAEAAADIGLKANLENQVADETRHKEEIERILAGWIQ